MGRTGPQAKKKLQGEERITDCVPNMTARQRRPKWTMLFNNAEVMGKVTRFHCHFLGNTFLNSQEDCSHHPVGDNPTWSTFDAQAVLSLSSREIGSHCQPKLASSSLCNTSIPQICHAPALASRVGCQECATVHSSHSDLVFARLLQRSQTRIKIHIKVDYIISKSFYIYTLLYKHLKQCYFLSNFEI